MTDRTKQWIDATKTLGFPIVVALLVMVAIVVPNNRAYMGVVERTVDAQRTIAETQAKMAVTLERVSTLQDTQTRTLEELTKLTQRSADCLQRVEAALRDTDRRNEATKVRAENPGG